MNNTITHNLNSLCNTSIELGKNYLHIPGDTTDSQLHAIGNARYLMRTDGESVGIVKQYILVEIETLLETAKALCK